MRNRYTVTVDLKEDFHLGVYRGALYDDVRQDMVAVIECADIDVVMDHIRAELKARVEKSMEMA